MGLGVSKVVRHDADRIIALCAVGYETNMPEVYHPNELLVWGIFDISL